MKLSTQLLSSGLAAAALMFTNSLTVAQSTPTNSVNRKSGSIVVGPKTAGAQGSNLVTSPLHESHGNSGQNPLFEPKDKSVAKPGTGATEVQPYKDPEDMTTRYRPGNNKTTVAHSNAGAPVAAAAVDQRQKTVENPVGEMKTSNKSLGAAHATESVQKKHLGNVK